MDTVKFKLAKDHVKGGILVPAGTVLEIPSSKVKWFEENDGGQVQKVISVSKKDPES